MEIKVYLNQNADKPIFQRILVCDSSVSFDFSIVLRAMRLLFGDHCIVTFKCVNV